MDIFQFASYASTFTDKLWISLLVGVLCFLIVYIFQGLGLYTIATREGYTKRWLAWIPFAQLYYIGVCAQKNKVFNNMGSRQFGLAVCIFDIIMFLGYVLYYVSYFLVKDYAYYTQTDYGYYYTYTLNFYNTLPANLDWAAWIYAYFYDYILSWLELIFIIMKLFLFTAFYRTYSSRRYMLFSIVGSLLPVNGIIVYVVRNNKGINYNDYIRRVREENYRRYQQQQQNPYNQNPYSRGYGAPPPQDDPYSQQNNYGQQNTQGSAPDPFEEYGSSGSDNSGNNSGGGSSSDDSPFDEFN
ncbi:MAG: hypothetical protein LUI60_00480 [Clostridia bacterium]|nr:hypothetical protein [Clostridia bacterium]